MGILQYITTGCDQLSATAAPLLNSMGLHIVLSLATIMMVWFGVQEAITGKQTPKEALLLMENKVREVLS